MKTDLSKNSLVQVYVIRGLKYRIGERIWIVERHANVVSSRRGYVLDYVIFCYVHDFYGWIVFHSALCNNLYALLTGDDVPGWREGHDIGVSDALTFILQKESYQVLSWKQLCWSYKAAQLGRGSRHPWNVKKVTIKKTSSTILFFFKALNVLKKVDEFCAERGTYQSCAFGNLNVLGFFLVTPG